MYLKANNCYEDLIDTLDKIIELMVKDKFNDCMEKNVNFVAKSSVTNTESNLKNDNVSTDKNIKMSGEVGGKKNAVQLF